MLPDKRHRAVCAEIIRQLRSERERRKLSKYAMAARSGLAQQTIGYVERGMRQPSLETVVRMAAALEIDLGELINRAEKAVPRT